MARESLLEPVHVPAGNVHRMEGERADLDGAARDYATPAAAGARHPSVRHWPRRTHGLALSRRRRPSTNTRGRVVPADSPFPPPRRLTITPLVIAAARRVAVIVDGADKADMSQRALEGPRDPHALPVQLAARRRVVPRSRGGGVEARAGAGMRVLAGDIGGTHARLAVVDVDERRVHIVREARYPSGDYPSLAPVVRTFLDAGSDAPERAAFGVAGPVSEGRVSTPNLPWTLDERRLSREIGIPRARLLNDLDAIARGTARLDATDVVTLQDGTPNEDGTIALIGAGTGLGEAFVVHDGAAPRTHPSEGGHAGFAPRTSLERELLAWLAADLGHVSAERVISGPGLEHIYRFLAERDPAREQRAVRRRRGRRRRSGHLAPRTDGSDALCVQALDIFVGAYGAQAGNLALTVLATGGVFLVGGIAPAIVKKLMDGTFLAAFRDKGRMSDMMQRMPVHVVMNDDVGLYGAAIAAAEDDARTTDAPRAPSASGAPHPKHTTLGHDDMTETATRAARGGAIGASDLDELCIDTVRTLSMDAVQQANSGHPGTPMALAPLAYLIFTGICATTRRIPHWPNRDRFVLSCGHASMLLYSVLYLTGYDVTLEDIKHFRQWGSKTPGHPEYGHTPGVETTTGPFGQGFANAVGMAIAERHLASEFNRPDDAVSTTASTSSASDGDLMEGISHEAASIAGHLG